MEPAFEVMQRAGVKYKAADVLWRLSINWTDGKDIDDALLVLVIKLQSREENLQLSCSGQDCDITTVSFEAHPIMMAEADGVEFTTMTDFVLEHCSYTFYK